ncbi:hypothetical protein ACIBCM_27585 [Streptomyces sp. NPDC051018]|uniref:hypothetical protein n=1 Tax=Streptomyces sp. NPDC051018 TaxID=3365639 RepID=UPI0037974D9D
MRRWIRAVPAVVGVVALAAGVTGCTDKSGEKKGKARASAPAEEKTAYRLGEASPPQESTQTASDGAMFTVTPTRVATGTKTDMDNSGLQKDEKNGPQIPVFVWTTLTHKSGPAMEVDDMDDDLVVRTAAGMRTKALLVMFGKAEWRNCPDAADGKKLSAGQSAQICTAFLVPEGQTAAAVELTQGWHKKPLEWAAGA